jgi:hypothetical protein
MGRRHGAGALTIPLRIKIKANANQPFVVRLRSFEAGSWEMGPERLNPFEAALEHADPEGADYVGEGGSIRVLGIDPSEVDGDVLLVNPRRGTADRLVRSSSPHNTFLVTERCDQVCVMCSQLPKKHHVDLFPYFETAALLAPEGATIGISGESRRCSSNNCSPSWRASWRSMPIFPFTF